MPKVLKTPRGGDGDPRGLACPTCGCGWLRVVRTIHTKHRTIRRTRECQYCYRRFITTEKAP